MRNKLGLHDATLLERAEYNEMVARGAYLMASEPLGCFDLVHYCKIHEFLFQNLYDWAGQFRYVEISKGATRFTPPDAIPGFGSAIFEELKSENYLRSTGDETFSARLAHFYSEINLLHPFREGNGRTEKVFFSQLLSEHGYRLAWERLDPKQNIAACIAAYHSDEAPLATMLDRLLELQ